MSVLNPMDDDQLDAVIQGLERIKALEGEIASLRLTDAERDAISFAYDIISDIAQVRLASQRLDLAQPYTEAARALRGIWDRNK